MIRDTSEERDREAQHGGTIECAIACATTAAELAVEFRAPVAIIDLRLRRWCSVVGCWNRSSLRSMTRSCSHAGPRS